MDLDETLRKMREKREWDRVNPENPVCRGGCNRRDKPENLTDGICAECHDDLVQMLTGCRYGDITCQGFKHSDCEDPI